MEKFLEVHDTLINTKDIRRVEFISDDIYLGLLPMANGQVIGDCIDFTYAKIQTFDNRVIDITLDLYAPEDEETEEMWSRRNVAYIAESMTRIYEILEPTKVTGIEYI